MARKPTWSSMGPAIPSSTHSEPCLFGSSPFSPMSAEAATLPTEQAGEAHAAVFRIAFAAAVGLTLGEVLRWDFPFLPAMLAVQLLSARGPLSVKQGLAFVAVMVAACVF